MKDYVLSAPSKEALASAVALLVSSGQRMDVAPPRGTAEETAPDEFGPITWTCDCTWHSDAELPILPEGVVIVEGPNGFTAARPRLSEPDDIYVQPARPDWYTVTLVQARSICDLQGLTPRINQLIDAMPEGPQKIIARNAWERSATISFDNPLLNALWPLLGLDSAHKESLFKAAHAIRT